MRSEAEQSVGRLVKCLGKTVLFIPILLRAWNGIALHGEIGRLPQILFIVFTPMIPFALIGCLIAQMLIFIGDEFCI